jgi:hypothetical protein
LKHAIFAKALKKVDVANARHLASLLARPAAVLQTRSVKAQRKASKSKMPPRRAAFFMEVLR